MLENLEINLDESSDLIPIVDFRTSEKHCMISGYSSPENSTEFYQKLTEWLDSYFGENSSLLFDFKLEYFNTASSKGILYLVKKLKAYEDLGKEIVVNWHYEEDDLDMLEEGEDFAKDTGMDLNFIEF